MLKRDWKRPAPRHFVWGAALALTGMLVTIFYTMTAHWINAQFPNPWFGSIVWFFLWLTILSILAWIADNL